MKWLSVGQQFPLMPTIKAANTSASVARSAASETPHCRYSGWGGSHRRDGWPAVCWIAVNSRPQRLRSRPTLPVSACVRGGAAGGGERPGLPLVRRGLLTRPARRPGGRGQPPQARPRQGISHWEPAALPAAAGAAGVVDLCCDGGAGLVPRRLFGG